MPEPSEPEPVVEFDPPAASVAWSPEFVAQTLEVLFVCLGPEGVRSLRPVHADSLRLGWPPAAKPGELVVEAAARYGLRALLVHSTSWRHEESRVVITYLAVVEPPDELSPHLADEPDGRSDLARGDAFGPPPEIRVPHVLEHALRHLAWLVKDDAVVRDTLGDTWGASLERYVPEPFRPLDSAR
ncbi:MAG: hypothetical protein WD770_09865 [Actinomycetota bacterium]